MLDVRFLTWWLWIETFPRGEVRTKTLRVVVLSNIAIKEREVEFAMTAGALAWYDNSKTTLQQLATSLGSHVARSPRL